MDKKQLEQIKKMIVLAHKEMAKQFLKKKKK